MSPLNPPVTGLVIIPLKNLELTQFASLEFRSISTSSGTSEKIWYCKQLDRFSDYNREKHVLHVLESGSDVTLNNQIKLVIM